MTIDTDDIDVSNGEAILEDGAYQLFISIMISLRRRNGSVQGGS